jgi:hypothetical protein
MIAMAFESSARAAPCPSSDGSPCLPDAATIDRLLVKIEAIQSLNSEIKSAFVVWSNAKGGSDGALELEKLDAYRNAKAKFDLESASLIDLIQKAYSVAPTRTSGAVRKPQGTSAMDWMDGVGARWKPRLSLDNNDYGTIKTKGGTHYTGVNTAEVAGATLPNGDVVIASSLLASALEDKNPGIIAETIYHEGRHFTDLITTGWPSIEQGEVDAYTAVAAKNDVFKLSKAWLDVNANALAFNQDRIQSGNERAFVVTAQEEGMIKALFDKQKADEVDMASYYKNLKVQVAQDAADREHDERLLATVAEIAARSCASPGSITQDELNRLPRPAKPEQFCTTENCRLPPTLGACGAFLFLEIAGRIRDGDALDAAEIRRRSEPIEPGPIRALPPPPQAVRPVENPPRIIGVDPVAETLKNYRRLAALACDSPDSLDADEIRRAVRTPYVPLPAAQVAGRDLTGCSRFIYDALVVFSPDGYRGMLTKQWLLDRVGTYRGQPSLPPSGGESGGGRAQPELPKHCYWDKTCNCRVCEQ